MPLARTLLIPGNPAHDISPGRWLAPPPKSVLTVAEVHRLLETPGEDTLGLRDRAILETLYSTALRRAELCGLDLYDLDLCSGAVMVPRVRLFHPIPRLNHHPHPHPEVDGTAVTRPRMPSSSSYPLARHRAAAV